MFSGAMEKNQPAEISAAPAKADTDSLAASSSLSAGAMVTGPLTPQRQRGRWLVASS